jgi:glycosyltransferase involved in cell wall biosynthesis
VHVVHIDRQRSFTGQIQRALAEVAALRRAGERVSVLAQPGSELARRARAQGVPVLELPMRGAAIYVSLLRAARALRGQGVDLFHCHGGRDQNFALALARLLRVRHVIRTKHNHTVPRGRRALAGYNACARVVAVSGFVRERMIAAGVDAARVACIPDAVDLERFRPRPRDAALAQALGIRPGERVVGNVSSLHERKGIEELLRAFARLRQRPDGAALRCLLVGRQHARWQALVGELGIEDGVLFPGFREDVPELLSLFDVYVLPSRNEALGTGALEAMAAGRALVVSDVEGLAEAVADGTGLRVPSRDPARLADAIGSLLDAPERGAALGAAARERAVAEYGAATHAARSLALYRDVLARRPRPADAARHAPGPPA